MSVEAVEWALDDAPMLRMPKSGENDTTARAVLVARAERADADGRNSHAGIDDVVWRTGYTRNTVRDAEKRLEAGGLMVRDGKTAWGSTRWRLVMTARRDQTERDVMAAKAEEKRAAHAKRELDRRASRALFNRARASLNGARARLNGERAPSVDPEPSLNHPGTTLEPPTGGAPPPDPRRAASPTAPRTYPEHSLPAVQDQPLDAVSNSLTRTRENNSHAATINTEPIAPPPATAAGPARCPHGQDATRTLHDGRPRCKACRQTPAEPEPTGPDAPSTPAPSPSAPACGNSGCVRGYLVVEGLIQRCPGEHPEVDLPAAPRPARSPAPTDPVWIAIHRRGVTAHRPLPAEPYTACPQRRSTQAGHTTTAHAIARHAPLWCESCWAPTESETP